MNLRGIGYIGVNVPDQQVWNDFAANVVGLQPVDPLTPGDPASYFRADDRRWRVAVHQSTSAGIAFVGFEVVGESDFLAAVAHLEAEGAAPKPATPELLASRGVRGLVTVEDPAGTCIEIFWGPTVDDPFQSPIGVSGFVSDGGFGHMVLLVRDLPAMMDFYQRVLGMRLTDFVNFGPGMSVQFLRCTPRHHTVALSAVGPVEGAHHIAFQVPTIDDVGAALDRATAAGLPITASLGRHKNDRMLSFYMRSPAGFEVEIGCDGRVIDEDTWVANEFTPGDLWGHHGLTSDSLAESVAEAAL